jgi:hypothetical protein
VESRGFELHPHFESCYKNVTFTQGTTTASSCVGTVMTSTTITWSGATGSYVAVRNVAGYMDPSVPFSPSEAIVITPSSSTAAASAAPVPNAEAGKRRFSAGMNAGIVMGALSLVLLTVAFVLVRRRMRNTREGSAGPPRSNDARLSNLASANTRSHDDARELQKSPTTYAGPLERRGSAYTHR